MLECDRRTGRLADEIPVVEAVEVVDPVVAVVGMVEVGQQVERRGCFYQERDRPHPLLPFHHHLGL